jgi:hypothetical protein
MTDAYKLEFFVEDDGTEPVLAWIKNDLTAAQRQAVGTASKSRQQREINTARRRLRTHHARDHARANTTNSDPGS